MNSCPKIRPATLADLPAILDLADALVRHDGQYDSSLDSGYNRSPEGTAWYKESIEDRDARVLVAEAGDAGKIVGVLIGRLDVPVPWRKTGGLLGELEILCVSPAERSGGFGRALLDGFAKWAREHGAVRLWARVSAGNADAIRFYKREKFSDYDVILERDLS